MAIAFYLRIDASIGSLSECLTFRAEVSRTSSQDEARHGRAAACARFAMAAVDAMELLKAAGHAVGVGIIAQGAAAMIDGAAQRRLDRASQC